MGKCESAITVCEMVVLCKKWLLLSSEVVRICGRVGESVKVISGYD